MAQGIATFFGTGLLPKMPGTWGSVAALPLAWVVWQNGWVLGGILSSIIFLVGTWAAHYYCNATGKHDNQAIVIDEVVGILIVTAIAPFTILSYCLAFLFFRFFDILKPPPIRWLDEHIPGGIGVMIDDVVAGIIALVPFYLTLTYILPLMQ